MSPREADQKFRLATRGVALRSKAWVIVCLAALAGGCLIGRTVFTTGEGGVSEVLNRMSVQGLYGVAAVVAVLAVLGVVNVWRPQADRGDGPDTADRD
jgi:hypothetical protein